MRAASLVAATLLTTGGLLAVAAPSASAGDGCPKGKWAVVSTASGSEHEAADRHDTNGDDQVCAKTSKGKGNSSATGSASGYTYVDNVF